MYRVTLLAKYKGKQTEVMSTIRLYSLFEVNLIKSRYDPANLPFIFTEVKVDGTKRSRIQEIQDLKPFGFINERLGVPIQL